MSEKVISITSGNEYRIHESNEKDVDDIFNPLYIEAAQILKTIVHTNREIKERWNQSYGNIYENTDFLNNIIAFTGERGQGKSTALYNFTKKIVKNEFPEIIKEGKFIQLDRIDPSLFDEHHNIMDVIIAKMFQNFTKKVNADNSNIGKEQRQKMIAQFQKVYKQLSIIAGGDKAIGEEYSYDGNMEKLACLAESTSLKEEFCNLVTEYIKLESKDEDKTYLLIAIDDLDMNIQQAYKMVEQIRKYMIVPNVIIIMAMRMEQLELCIQKENMKALGMLIRCENKGVQESLRFEIRQMANRYLDKLIPYERRIALPKIRAIASDNRETVYFRYNTGNVNNDNKKKFPEGIFELLYKKTGICLIPEEGKINYFFPETMREFISLAVLLCKMQDIDFDIINQYEQRDTEISEEEQDNIRRLEENLLQLENYIKRQWLKENIQNKQDIDDISELFDKKDEVVNSYVMQLLRKRSNSIEIIYSRERLYSRERSYSRESIYSMGNVIAQMDRIQNMEFSEENDKYLYGIRLVYSVMIQKIKIKRKIKEVVNGTFWGGLFEKFYQQEKLDNGDLVSRAYIKLETKDLLYRIVSQLLIPEQTGEKTKTEINELYDKAKEIVDQNVSGKPNDIPRLKGKYDVIKAIDENYKIFWKALCIAVLLRNRELKEELIYDNYIVAKMSNISFEAYLVNILDTKKLYKNSGFGNVNASYDMFIENIRPYIEEPMYQFSNFLCNSPDALLVTAQYCIGKNDPHGASDTRYMWLVKTLDKWINENIYIGEVYKFKPKSSLADNDGVKLICGILEGGETKKLENPDILLIFALESIGNVESFESYLEGVEIEPKKLEKPVSFLKTKTKERLEENLKIMMRNTAVYKMLYDQLPENFDYQSFLNLYIDCLQCQNKKTVIDKLAERYKEVALNYRDSVGEREAEMVENFQKVINDKQQ